jgi:hypothetical protein
MHFLYSVYCEVTASTCFRQYLLVFRRHCVHNIRYILCVLGMLAATRVGGAQYTQNIPLAVYTVPTDDEQAVLETCRGRGKFGVQTPPRNSEVLTKLSRIPSSVEKTSVTT